MASITCTTQLIFASQAPKNSSFSSGSAPNFPRLWSQFMGKGPKKLRNRPTKNGSRTITCWFKFGQNGVDAEGAGIYGSQSRDDYDRDDVEQIYFHPLQYFNYMGMLAVEGTYDKLEALLSQNIHPVDILLMMAASEGDKPKLEELLRAGADYTVKDANGLTALDKAASDEIKDLILGFSPQKA
ncbi:hypothetical protein RHSIM_Rhsim04G0001800 [Rhododendron simsii]|uniref:Protein LHCP TRANSLOCATION DEFECT n=1 Tax=Rhododendron simsii TaxID=118357 RepID=A0A834H407_RHOSS|nr:hypothetical protein RHSIM_Rhsim04G0001800 [Rhododendron simsii]